MNYHLGLLFLNALLSATILPIGSEPLFIWTLQQDIPWPFVVAAATTGNVLGAVINYLLGWWGAETIIAKCLRITPTQLDSARERFGKWGTGSLFFAWVPIVGDPLTVLAGVLRVSPMAFLILVSAGKFLRYLAVTGVALNWL